MLRLVAKDNICYEVSSNERNKKNTEIFKKTKYMYCLLIEIAFH